MVLRYDPIRNSPNPRYPKPLPQTISGKARGSCRNRKKLGAGYQEAVWPCLQINDGNERRKEMYRVVADGYCSVKLVDDSLFPGPEITPDLHCSINANNTVYSVHMAKNGRCFVSINKYEDGSTYLTYFCTDNSGRIMTQGVDW